MDQVERRRVRKDPEKLRNEWEQVSEKGMMGPAAVGSLSRGEVGSSIVEGTVLTRGSAEELRGMEQSGDGLTWEMGSSGTGSRGREKGFSFKGWDWVIGVSESKGLREEGLRESKRWSMFAGVKAGVGVEKEALVEDGSGVGWGSEGSSLEGRGRGSKMWGN